MAAALAEGEATLRPFGGIVCSSWPQTPRPDRWLDPEACKMFVGQPPGPACCATCAVNGGDRSLWQCNIGQDTICSSAKAAIWKVCRALLRAYCCTAAPNTLQPAPLLHPLQTIGPGYALTLAHDAVIAYGLACAGAETPWADQGGTYEVEYQAADGHVEQGKLISVRITACGIPLFNVENGAGATVTVSHVRTAPSATGAAMPPHTPKPREYRGANLVITGNLKRLGCECSTTQTCHMFTC